LSRDLFTVHDLRRTGSRFRLGRDRKGHTISGVRGIYNRAEYSNQWREMLQFWADYVDALVNEKKVIA
jgi:hypothetical protein